MILKKTFPLSARGVRKDAPTPPVTPVAAEIDPFHPLSDLLTRQTTGTTFRGSQVCALRSMNPPMPWPSEAR